MRIRIDGKEIDVPEGTTVLAAVLGIGKKAVRTSVSGQPRGPLCGMGVCYECRMMVDGIGQSTSCQLLVQDGMEIRTDA